MSKATDFLKKPQREGTTTMDAARLSTELGLEPVRHESFAERVYDSLFHSIITGKLASGSRLPSEMELARLFQVSRPVVRQALDALRDAGLVESVRGSGTYVRGDASPMPVVPLARSPASISHFLHGLELRLIVEPECAFLAALRRKTVNLERIEEMLNEFEQASERGAVAHHFDFGFHEAIAEATSNPRLAQVLKSLEYDLSHAVSLWRHLALKKGSNMQHALDEHRTLFNAIKCGDAEVARSAMRRHLENAGSRFLQLRNDVEVKVEA